ncbi:MAG TPA: translocation/assembly module TamB domain-containing protein [Blastocatellia bacterium]|nr:translocation/assembly module TamB domain-containing protein [Blastocatellia bacterium]
MRKHIGRAVAVLLMIIALFSLTAFWYLHSGRFDSFVAQTLVERAGDYGARVEVGHLESTLSGLGVRMTDVRVYPVNSNDPIVVVPELTANVVINSLWGFKVSLSNLQLIRPQLYIRFDSNGVSNLSGLHTKSRKETRTEEEKEIKVRYPQVRIVDGSVVFNDVQHKIDGDVRNLSFDLTPAGITNQLSFNFEAAHCVFDNRIIDNIKTNLRATIDEKHAVVQSLVIESPISKSTLQGEVTSLKEAAYSFKVNTEFNLAEAGKIFAPSSGLIGTATFNGDVTGKGTDYKVTGELKSDNMTALNAQAGGLSLNIGLNGENKLLSLNGNLALDYFRYRSINVIDGGGFRADVTTDGKAVRVDSFDLNAFGGHAVGKAVIALSKDSNSTLDANLKDVNLHQLIQLAARKPAPVNGTVNGKANLNWNGTDFKTIDGQLSLVFKGETRPVKTNKDSSASVETAKATPFSGSADVDLHSDLYEIKQLKIEAADTQVTADGRINSQLASDLKINLQSKNTSTAQEIAKSFGALPEYVENYQLQLNGPGSFAGTVKGKITSPTVTGQLDLSNIKIRDESAGHFTASLNASRELLKLTNATLVRNDGSRIDFTVDAPFHRKNAITISANIKNIDLPFVAKSVDPDLSDSLSPLSGKINGNLSLNGLPGTDVPIVGRPLPIGGIHGNLNLAINGLVIKDEPVNRAEGTISLDDRLLSLKGLSVAFRGGQFNVDGSLNIESLNYDVSAKVDNLSLDYFKERSEQSGGDFPLSGFINASLIGKGSFSQNDISFKLTANGRDLAINDEPITSPTLVVEANTGEKAKLDFNASIRNQPHHITGTLDLLNDDGPVLHAEENLQGASLDSYLALIGTLPHGVSSKAAGKLTFDDTVSDFTDPLQSLTAALDLNKYELHLGSDTRFTNDGPLQLAAGTKQIDFKQFHLTGEGSDITLTGIASLSPDVTSTLAAKGQLSLKLIGSFSSFLTTDGTAPFSAAVAGNGDKPEFDGYIDIKGLSVKVAHSDFDVTNGNGRVVLKGTTALIQSLSAQSGAGTLNATGELNFEGFAPDRWHFQIKGSQSPFSYSNAVKMTVDSDLIYQGNRSLQVLSGSINILHAEFDKEPDIGAMVIKADPPKPKDSEKSAGLVLDLAIQAANTMFIRNKPEPVGSARLHVQGSVDAPTVSGKVTVLR